VPERRVVDRVREIVERTLGRGERHVHLAFRLRERGGEHEWREIFTVVRSEVEPSTWGLFDENDAFLWAMGFTGEPDWADFAEGLVWAVEMFTEGAALDAEQV
jgi:hypothetical protein